VPLDFLGLQKTSLTDYPGRVAAVLFTHGCNMSCGWCHNGTLVKGPRPEDFLPREEILSFLLKRKNVLGGVAITGGEPLLHEDLPQTIEEIRALGFKVKLDTNGSFPERLPTVDVDYIAMDLKVPPKAYGLVGYYQGEAPLVNSIKWIKQNHVPHEFRTVWVPKWSRKEYIPAMAEALGQGELFYIAPFRPGTCLDPGYNSTPAADKDVVKLVVEEFKKYGVDARLRGWD